MSDDTDTVRWTDLDKDRSPYTDWFDSKEREVFYKTQAGPSGEDKNAFITRTFNPSSFFQGPGPDILSDRFLASSNGNSTFKGGTFFQGISATSLGFDTDRIPFLADTVDSKGEEKPITIDTGPLRDLESLAARLDPNAVLTGVIDVGISPFHERFRATANATRIITCWQQAGAFTEGLPFGSELNAEDIDAALGHGSFDEETALRKYHVSRPEVLFGSREVDFRAAHGTHIADLAAGGVPSAEKPGKIRNPILAVNMPPRYSHGSAGNFLDFFAFAAVVRIVNLADQLWQEVHKGTSDAKEGPGGFPLVINLSFGMHAGAKDGSALFERLVHTLVGERRAPTDIVMPAGNDNLNRGTARALVGREKSVRYRNLAPLETLSLDWRVPPSDRSSNFVELWFPALGPDRNDIEFCVIPPGATSTKDDWHKVIGQTDKEPQGYQYMDLLSGAVRLYRVARHAEHAKKLRPQIMIGLMPTEFFGSIAESPPTLAPAGLWTIKVRAKGSAVNVYAHVQSDQDIRPGRGRQAIRSYFDLEKYDTHTHPTAKDWTVPTGMPQDSVYLARAFENRFAHLDDWNTEGPVQRKGTNNSIATTPSILVIGAYRVSDRTATVYSATVEDELYQEGPSRDRNSPVIEALFPGDDSPMHLGMLGAGSRSGSAVTFQGTSSSSALAARAIVEWRLNSDDRRRGASARSFLQSRAKDEGYGARAPLKIGNGLVYTQTERARHETRITGILTNPYL